MGLRWCIDLLYIWWLCCFISLLGSVVLLVVHLQWYVSPWSFSKKCISELHKMYMLQKKYRGGKALHHADFQKQHILDCYLFCHFLSLIFGSCSIFSQQRFCFLCNVSITPANIFPITDATLDSFWKRYYRQLPIRKQPYIIKWWGRKSLNSFLRGLWAKIWLLL